MCFKRAAASSIANGNPSVRAQMSATNPIAAGDGVKPGATAEARSRKSSTAADGVGFRAYLKRRYLNLMLTAQPEWRATGRQDGQVWGCLEKIGDGRSGGNQVLESVQDDQCSALSETSRQRLVHVPSGWGKSDRCRDQRKHHLGVVRVGQADEKGATREVELGC